MTTTQPVEFVELDPDCGHTQNIPDGFDPNAVDTNTCQTADRCLNVDVTGQPGPVGWSMTSTEDRYGAEHERVIWVTTWLMVEGPDRRLVVCEDCANGADD